jgi:hypothetical protein
MAQSATGSGGVRNHGASIMEHTKVTPDLGTGRAALMGKLVATTSSRRGATCALWIALIGIHYSAAVLATAPHDVAQQTEGIWKVVVPPRPMQAEFNGYDPVGVAAGAKIQADCSLNWVNPDDGSRYCFSSGTSLQYFLDRPHAMIQRARETWHKMIAAGRAE